ncbi:MAG: xanthine dehydrogenase family protein molybdopterin-binding subunit [Anaerolineae bacterium]
MRVVGQRVKRVDALDKVTGRTQYPGDIYMEGMLYGKVLWSERAHARILAIDTSAAEAYPGVVDVFTAADVPVNEMGLMMNDEPVLAEGKVRCVGDPLAVVVAETEEAAQAALDLIRVEYEDLPVVSDPREAMKPDASLVHEEKGSNILHHYYIYKGDVEAGFAQADVIVEGYYHTPHNEHAFLQPEAGLGYLEEGKIIVLTAAQWAHDDRRQIAHALQLPEEQVRVIYTPVGGAFGGREDISLQIFLAMAAQRTGRPVKMVWSRQESIRGHHKRHPYYMRCKTGATRDGKLVALEAEVVADIGAYCSSSGPVLGGVVTLITGPYEIPNVKIDGYNVYTNNLPAGAMRAFGAPQANFAAEGQMARLAEALGMDPVEFRLRNVLREGSRVGSNTVVPGGVGIGETLERAARAAGWREVNGHWVRPRREMKGTWRKGTGVAAGWKNVGYSFGWRDRTTAVVEIYGGEEMERAVVKCGVAEVGQGVMTTLVQIAAEVLGLPLERVELITADTDVAPNAGSSSASRQAYVSGNAVKYACLEARERWAAGERPAIAWYEYLAPQTTPFDPVTGQGRPHFSYAYGTHVVELEVDTETGQIHLGRVWAAHDVGKAINPLGVEGQIEGGAIMAQGYALMEEFIQEEGLIKTPTLAEYLIPTSMDIPRGIESIIVEDADPDGPYGATGVGEMANMLLAPAIVDAIHDATGIWFDDIPITSEKMLMALKEKEEAVKELERV